MLRVLVHVTTHYVNTFYPGRNFFQMIKIFPYKGGFLQKIFGRVTKQAKLWKHGQVTSQFLGALSGIEDQVRIVVEITDDGIYLA